MALLIYTSIWAWPIGARKGQPQTPNQANFSVRIARLSPKGTATNTKSSGFLCSNSPSEPERDSHKHHTKRISLFERAIGDRIHSPSGLVGVNNRNCQLYLVSRLTLCSQACATSGVGIIYSEIVRTGTQTRYAPYEVLGFDVRAFRLCANASEP